MLHASAQEKKTFLTLNPSKLAVVYDVTSLKSYKNTKSSRKIAIFVKR